MDKPRTNFSDNSINLIDYALGEFIRLLARQAARQFYAETSSDQGHHISEPPSTRVAIPEESID